MKETAFPTWKMDDPAWASPAGKKTLELAREVRLARRERIREIYSSGWHSLAREGEGLPLVPDDHIMYMGDWLQEGNPPEAFPLIAEVRGRLGVVVAAGYSSLLAAEALSAIVRTQ